MFFAGSIWNEWVFFLAKVNPTQAKKSLFESLTLFSEMLKMNT